MLLHVIEMWTIKYIHYSCIIARQVIIVNINVWYL